MDHRSQDELLEILDALRQQVGPGGLIIPLGSWRYRPTAMVVAGYFYPLELVARAFADPETGHADLAAPVVLVYDGVLADSAQLRQGLAPVLELVLTSKPRRPLAIFAQDIDGVALTALVNSQHHNLIAAIGCVSLLPEEGSHYLHTVARICGAGVISAGRTEWGWSKLLGSANRLLADQRRVIILEPAKVEQANLAPQPIGLLTVGGADRQAVRESIEWVEGLLGH